MKTDIICLMRLIAALLLIPTMARGVTVESLPLPEFADTEVTAHHRLQQPTKGLRELDFRLDFKGTSSNNVEVVFGRDGDEDGALAPHETDVVVGWECGQYFIERFRTGERIEEPDVGTNDVERSLAWHYTLRKSGKVFKAFAVTNEVGAVFAQVSTNAPAWLYSRDWNLMRLTARGVDVQGERFEVEVQSSGFSINLR